MSSEDYIVNIDIDTIDSAGNKLLWSNDVVSVFYYDTTVSGSEQNWVRNWDYINPIANNTFSLEEPGTQWELVTDDPSKPYTFEIGRNAIWNTTDLLYGKSVTSSGYTWPYNDTYLVDYNADNGWETDDGVGFGVSAVSFDIGESTDVNYFWFIPGWGTDATKGVKNYRIGISDTGNENDYNIVVSGTTTSGLYAPIIEYIGNVQTRYIKLYIDGNWGHSTRSRVLRASAFYEPDWHLYGYRNDGLTDGTDAYLQQTADLSNTDYLFFDVRASMASAAQVGRITIMASGVGGTSNDILKDYTWSNTGTAWLDSLDSYDGLEHWTRWEEQVDVSGYTGDTAIKIRMYQDTLNRRYFFGYVDNIAISPRWYTEQKSEFRGDKSAFPDQAYIIADRRGVSIIDKSDTTLWMRFQVGPGYMLESSARQVVAKNGCIYLATTRGLIIIDFENNKAWKIDSSGVHYRMSLGKRNEYAKWFVETSSHVLPSNDVYSVAIGEYSGSSFVVVGHGYGLSYINTPTVLATRTISDSNFTYPIRKLKVYSDDTGEVNRIIYIGGYDNKARLGVIEDIAAITTTGFDDQILFFNVVGMESEVFTNSISPQWSVSNGGVPAISSSSYTTISGVKTEHGHTLLVQKELIADQPFIATVDVKIDKWPLRGDGGFHFGVTSGWPVVPILYEVTSQAMSLSARNGVVGQVIEDESFSLYPDLNSWGLTLNSQDNTIVTSEDQAIKIHAYITGVSGDNYFLYNSFGSIRTFTSRDFTAKIKVKCTRLDLSVDSTRQSAVFFGISDGRYLGEGTGENILGLSLASALPDIDPPEYAVCYTDTYQNMYWDTTTTLATFTGDTTASAGWRQWEFSFDSSTKTISAAVNGYFVGSYTLASIGTDIGIIFGVGGNVYTGYATAYFKDFEIDFGDNPDYAVREYVVQSYDDGTYTIPTVSGSHLDGLPFNNTDGTYSSDWRTWKIEYSVDALYGYVDDVSVGDPATIGLGNNNQRLFLYYNQPSLVSGTDDDRDVDIKFRNFTIQYTAQNTIISGSPNDFWLEEGEYLGVNYNSLYLATTSGVQRLSYLNSSTVSGTPVSSATFGVAGAGYGSEILYGNIKNTTALEVEQGAAGDNGLLYTASSKYYLRGWERLVNRAGTTDTANDEVTITVAPDGSRLYLWMFDSNPYLYYIDTGVLSTKWVLFNQSDYPQEFSSIQGGRGWMFDMQDGNLYCISADFFGVYKKNDTAWALPEENIGHSPIYLGGGIFKEWNFTPIYPKYSLFGLYAGLPTLMPLQFNRWTLEYRHSRDDWWAEEESCVYSDVDDSIYAFRKDLSTNNFNKMPMDTLIFSDALDDCPFPYDFSSGMSAFYRPYDESIYFISMGSTQSYGRRLLRFDIKNQSWFTWGEDFPDSVSVYMSAAYAFEEDAIYVIAGISTTTMYKYYFPRNTAPYFIYWEPEDNALPEDSTSARYRKISFNTQNPSDSFTDSSLSTVWFKDVYGTGSKTITEGSEYINILCDYQGQASHCSIVRAVPVPACSFTATAQIRINDMARSTGQVSGSRNTFLFGVTDFLGTPGTVAESNEVEISFSTVGYNGLFLAATNDESDDVNKYSIYKAELTSDTYYNGSQYLNFDSNDATDSAQFKEWRIEYDHSNKQLDAYIDGASVGTISFSGDGFMNGASLYLGAQRWVDAVSGTINVDVKNLNVLASGTTTLVSDYMIINDEDEYNQIHYEKLDRTIVSGTGYVLESEWRIDTYSLTDNVYISSVGSMEDGQKQAAIAALYTGDRKIGLYKGGDPRLESSYTAVDHDWSIKSVYKLVSDASTVKLYIDDEVSPSIDIDYDDLPNSYFRRCRFGSFNPDLEEHIWVPSRGDNLATISGSWALNEQPSAFYGRDYSIVSNSVDDKIICPVYSSGAVYIYMYYAASAANSTSVPVTIYHEGAIDIPVADSYATNPFNSIADNEDEYGNVDNGATKLILNQEKLAGGANYDRLPKTLNKTPSGWVYLGKYTDVSRIVVTNGNSGATVNDYVSVDSFLLKQTNTHPKARSSSRVYNIGYTIGEGTMVKKSDFLGGFTVIDMSTKTQIDAYGEQTSPNIESGDIYTIDVIQ